MTVTVEADQAPRHAAAVRILRRVGAVTATAVAVVLAGWVAAGMTPLHALLAAGILTVGLALVVAILIKPEIGALAILVLVAIFPIDSLFQHDLRVLSGGLKVTDFLLIATLGAWLVTRIVDPRPVRLPSAAVTNLVLAFVAFGLLGVFTARSSGVELKWSLLELRAILSLLLIFPVVDGVRRLKDLEVGLAVFLVAVGVSAVVITREFLLGQGGVSTFSDDATRINNLVYLYPLAGIAWAVALVPFARNRATRVLVVLLAGLSAAALYFTFRRGGWVVALLLPIGVMALLPRHRRGGLVRKLLLLTGSIVVVIAVANSFSSKPIKSPLTSGRDRLFSLGQTVDDVSTRHRLAEFKEARKLILRHPLTGIGLGATITFVSPLYNQDAESADVPQTNVYVHDSYEWVALKLGLPAFGVFLLLLGAVLRDGYRGYRRVHDPRSSRLMLGGFAMLVALVVLSLTEPHLTYVGSAPLFAAVIAVTQLVPQLSDREFGRTGLALRILVLSPIVPFPPDDGGRIRAYELLRGLAHAHDVEMLTLTDGSGEESEALAALRAEGLHVDAVTHDPDRRAVAMRSLLTARSLYGGLVRSRPLDQQLRQRLSGGDIDSVQCVYSSMAVYRRSAAVPWVLDAQNVEFRISESLGGAATGLRTIAYRAYSRREARRRRSEEIAAWERMDHVTAVSEVDRAIIEDLAPGTATTVVPNCVDGERLRPSPHPSDGRPSGIFVGKMDYRPNVDAVRWFSEEILPRVRARVPRFELMIVGKDPAPVVRALNSREGIRVTGWVPNTAPLLHDASLAVVPLRAGSGSRLKVLESLAAGTPVVSTSLGVEGLDVEPDRHVVIADDAAAFADAVVDLLADPDRRARLAREGRRLVEDRYRWPQAVRALVAVHEGVAERHRASHRG